MLLSGCGAPRARETEWNYRRGKRRGRVPIDLRGQAFGRLRVVDFGPPRDDGRLTWRCVCECGARVVAAGSHLRQGQVRSCGCLRKELASWEARKRNARKRLSVVLRALDALRVT